MPFRISFIILMRESLNFIWVTCKLKNEGDRRRSEETGEQEGESAYLKVPGFTSNQSIDWDEQNHDSHTSKNRGTQCAPQEVEGQNHLGDKKI